ncbi:hypothetical protein JCM6882_000747 [Rhodosporidiobolus microsporus]
MLRLALPILLASLSLSSALVVPRASDSDISTSKRGLLDLNLDADLLHPNPKKGLLTLDLTGSVLKNPKTGSALLDLDTSLDVLKKKGGKVLDLDADAMVGKNGRTGASLIDADVDATVGGKKSLIDVDADATVGNNGRGSSLLDVDLDPMVLSRSKGLLDATATVTSGAKDLLGVAVGSGKSALLDLDVLGTILGPQQCTGNAVVGIQAEVSVGKLLHLCVCVEVLGLADSRKSACPACPANADPICGSGSCGCKCRDGYFAHPKHGCLPIDTCTSSGGHIRRRNDGTSVCKCPSPFVPNNAGGCSLPPSARARRYARQAPQVSLRNRDSDEAALVEGDAYRCPSGERACPVGSNGSWECVDVTNELESCGGCPGEPSSVNCLSISGVENVACVESQCMISSCLTGYRHLNGRCVRTARN